MNPFEPSMNDTIINDNIFHQYDHLNNINQSQHSGATIEDITDIDNNAVQLSENELLAEDEDEDQDRYAIQNLNQNNDEDESDSDDELYEPESYLNYLQSKIQSQLHMLPKHLKQYSRLLTSYTGRIVWSFGTTAVFFGVPYMCALQLEQIQTLNNECLARYQTQLSQGQPQPPGYNPYAAAAPTGAGIPLQ